MALTKSIDRSAVKTLMFEELAVDPSIVKWLASFPALRRVEFHRCTHVPRNLVALLESCQRSLRSLALVDAGLADADVRRVADLPFQKIVEFDLSGNDAITSLGLDYLAARAPPLRALTVGRIAQLTDVAFTGACSPQGLLATHGPTLETFATPHCTGLGDETCAALFVAARGGRAGARLRELDLSYMPKLTDEGLRTLLDTTEMVCIAL